MSEMSGKDVNAVLSQIVVDDEDSEGKKCASCEEFILASIGKGFGRDEALRGWHMLVDLTKVFVGKVKQ